MSKVELLDFSATWCGPCKMQKPHLEKVEAELAGQIDVKVIDVDQNPESCSTIWYSGSTYTYHSQRRRSGKALHRPYYLRNPP